MVVRGLRITLHYEGLAFPSRDNSAVFKASKAYGRS